MKLDIKIFYTKCAPKTTLIHIEFITMVNIKYVEFL